MSEGEVRFTGEGTGDNVTIAGTPISGIGNKILYRFKLSSWFTYNDILKDWPGANAYCLAQPGYSLPSVAQMSNQLPATDRAIGALWNEWGDLTTYPTGFTNYGNWSSERAIKITITNSST